MLRLCLISLEASERLRSKAVVGWNGCTGEEYGQKRDLFTITKKQGRCRKYDVALYKRADGAYVLHRIVKVLPDGYVFLGDNCLNKEYGITDQDILGVMTSFVRDGKEHAADAGGCLLYAKLWYMIYPVRSLWKRLKMRIRNIIHK